MDKNILLVDAGNTRLKCWELTNQELTKNLVFEHSSIEEAYRFFGDNRWNQVLICNTGYLDEELNSHFRSSPVHFIGPDSISEIKWAYAQPENLGKDRIAALIGARKLQPGKNICVADAGTCLTIDVLDSKGNHIGGIISPGLQMRLQSMHEKTKNLPLSTEKESVSPLGNSTLSCLASGAVWGLVSEIEFHFNNLEKDDLFNPVLFLTGGDAEFLAHRLKVPNFVPTDLVFQGMIAVWASLE